jgi:hypothetical protein
MTVRARLQKDFRVCLMITNRAEIYWKKTPTWMHTRHSLLCIQRRTFHAKTTQITVSNCCVTIFFTSKLRKLIFSEIQSIIFLSNNENYKYVF